MSFIGASLFLLLGSAPMVNLSPYSARRLPDGAVEYAYDLTPVKAGVGSADARALHGEAAVKAFLKALPSSMKLMVAPGAPLDIAAGRGVEPGRLATSFATISQGPLVVDNPLALEPKSRLKVALDPAEPHLLLSAEAIAWQVRQLELSALAATELDTQSLRRELWSRVLERALERQKSTEGDAHEGALALVARVAAASACLDKAKVAPSVRASAEASAAVDSELDRLSRRPGAQMPPEPWKWRPELACIWVGAQAMSEPFEASRGGTAAVLTFLHLIGKDARLAALWERLRLRRDAFLGAPAGEPLLLWREKAGGQPGEAMEALGAFLEALPEEARRPPPLLAAPSSSYQKFISELSGAEASHAFVELANALQDGRMVPTGSSWPGAREAALAALCLPESNGLLRFDGMWSQRLLSSFVVLLGGGSQAGGDNQGPQLNDEGERTELKVRLWVPPALELEPLPALYERSAQSLEQLKEALQTAQLTGLQALGSDGQSLGPILPIIKTWISRLRGLAALADPRSPTHPALVEARRFAVNWRAEPAFARDVRQVSASPATDGRERLHAAIVGVSRRELVATFAEPPRIRALGGSSEAFTFTPSEQRYIVPVLVAVEANAEASRQPLKLPALKALVDGAGREVAQVEGAFVEALR